MGNLMMRRSQPLTLILGFNPELLLPPVWRGSESRPTRTTRIESREQGALGRYDTSGPGSPEGQAKAR